MEKNTDGRKITHGSFAAGVGAAGSWQLDSVFTLWKPGFSLGIVGFML
jgi:hypothetical protein